jgi:hypothetical protein
VKEEAPFFRNTSFFSINRRPNNGWQLEPKREAVNRVDKILRGVSLIQ